MPANARVSALLDDLPAARDWLAARPMLRRWVALLPLDDDKPAETFRREALALSSSVPAGEEARFDRVLRRYRRKEMLRIALRDLQRRATLRSVTHELSALADALLEAALAFWDRTLAPKFGGTLAHRFTVVGMGKLGGRELNYSSDIDVLFLFDADGDTPNGKTVRAQALELARRIIRSLATHTPDGFCFRVDADLRPWGRDGPLATPLDELERYYEQNGRTWERAAWIKARPSAGAIDVALSALERLRPFVWRRSTDLAVVEALAQMKGRIDRAQAGRGDDVKLGPGGIREIEFFAQALQLLHGGRRPPLRVRATLDALDALVFAGLVAPADRAALADAYVFLRDVEHRLQLPLDQQTQHLPDDDAGWRRLARLMQRPVGDLRAELEAHRANVRRRFNDLLATASETRTPPPLAEAVLSPDADDPERENALVSLGFMHAEAALADLRRLQRVAEGPFGARGRERFPGLAERLVQHAANTPDPDAALAGLASLRPPAWDAATLASTLAEHPSTARLLLLLFAASEPLGRNFVGHPELLDALVRSDAATLKKPRAVLEDEVRRRLEGVSDPVDRANVLRRTKREELLRIGLHDLAGRLDRAAAAEAHTQLAEVLLAETVALAKADVVERYGRPERDTACILGMGSFGGRELGDGSDLDLVFVHDAQGMSSGGTRGAIDANEWVARLAQKVLGLLTTASEEGVLYPVDSRLRPSGTQGALVAAFDAFATYHSGDGARGAQLWERQALVKARVVYGDRALAARIEEHVLRPHPPETLPADAAAQIAAMRRRLDATAPAHGLDPKKGPGGLLDVDFAVQWLLLKHAIREPSTVDAIERLRRRGHLRHDDANQLRRTHDELRTVERRLRLRYGRTDVYVPLAGPSLTEVARLLGLAGRDAGPRFLAHLQGVMARMRELFDRLVPPA